MDTSSPISPPQIEEELKRVNQQMYEQNLELSVRNRTLVVLRKMYDIINTTYGVAETAQKLTEAIVSELNFRTVVIALVDKEQKILQAVGNFPDRLTDTEETAYMGTTLKNLKLSLQSTENFCVDSLTHNRMRLTNDLHDVLTPLVDEEHATHLQEKLNIQTSIIFPIVFAGNSLGILLLGLDKHIGDLSRAERETMRELIEVTAIAIERSQIYADLQTAIEKLKEMDQLKDEFVSVTSHELRTPMTAIKSYAWMVLHDKAGPLEPKAKEYLDRVYLSTERLINLVNDMLDVSRIESGKVQMKIESFDILQLSEEVKQEFHARSAERTIAVEAMHEGEIPHVLGDREKIHQVLENLVGNAFKFTPNGGKITISSKQTDGVVQTSVTDTGKGIPKEDVKKLFTKFGRLSNSLVSISESGGTGLGLYICKQYIELQKGKIWAESDTGKGATFIFTLPKA